MNETFERLNRTDAIFVTRAEPVTLFQAAYNESDRLAGEATFLLPQKIPSR